MKRITCISGLYDPKMGNPEHLAMLKFGTSAWNVWRAENPNVIPDLNRAHFRDAHLSSANLARADLRLAFFGKADLSGADLRAANLAESSLRGANFAKAVLDNADLSGADLTGADFSGARIVNANLSKAYLERANLTGADIENSNLKGSDLRFATAVDTNFRHADLTDCQVYGIAAWNTNLFGAMQRDLVITKPDEHTVTMDSLHVAQFVYLLLNNRSIRDVIETVGKKAILILGRFAPEQKNVLNLIRDRLRSDGLVPILFDFDGPANRDLTETISTLAHLARAVIVDISEPKSVPQELMAIIPSLPSVPIFPIISGSTVPYSLFEHFRRYPWVHQTFCYGNDQDITDWLATAFREVR